MRARRPAGSRGKADVDERTHVVTTPSVHRRAAAPRRAAGRRRPVAVLAVIGLVLSVLVLAAPDPASAVVPFTVHGSVDQVSVTGLTPGAAVTLHHDGSPVTLVHRD